MEVLTSSHGARAANVLSAAQSKPSSGPIVAASRRGCLVC